MGRVSLKKRYDAFCKEAQELLEKAGLARPDQTPVIIGKAFHEACNKLATIHFPEDAEISGNGPRAMIWDMYRGFDKKSDDLTGAMAVADVIQRIIKHRPPLDVKEIDNSNTKHPKSVSTDPETCPFYESGRKYFVRRRSVFVLMPFTEPWSDRIWNEHILRYLRVSPNGKKINVRRADDMYGQAVMEDVFEGIATAHLVLAECTGRNPNVLYELGMAHSLGKRTVLLSQNAKDIPFDLQRFRFCIYEDNSTGYPKLKHFLEETVREAIN
ncbi:MAG: hypothetical protein KAT34_20615 [Candidatus Aminicenantes bacterium]|nr:hypothetical protein [Candidatus Aminicenantes bacterium]